MNENKPIRIGVVDDNPVNRNSFLQKMASYSDVSVNMVCSGGHAFLEEIKGLPLQALPSVIFMDIEMPGLNGIETIRMAKALHDEMHFIVLTVFEDDDNIFQAIQAGAAGYLLKHEGADHIHSAIQEILEYGGAPMSPAVARKTLKLLGQQRALEESNKNNVLTSLLSEREREVLVHMVNGYDAKRIAELVGISTLTVRKHISNIYTKLHVNSRAQVITMAHKNNWLS